MDLVLRMAIENPRSVQLYRRRHCQPWSLTRYILGVDVVLASTSSSAVDNVRLLKERLGRQRIRFTDAERRRLAQKAFAIGRKALNELQTLVTPRGTRYLILDRDTKYSAEFRAALVRDGIHLIRLPPRSPNLNAFAERFVRSIKSECLSRMIFFGRDSLQHAISQFMSHYHAERNHQGLQNRLLRPAPATTPFQPVRQRQRLGGMLNYYYRAA